MQNRGRHWVRQSVQYAALFLLPLAVALFFLNHMQRSGTTFPVQREVIKAGQSQAVLTLSAGEQLLLNSGVQKFEEQGTCVHTDSGRLSYQSRRTGQKGRPEMYNTIRIPRGGEYFVTLSDGTRIWLNAETQLKFPVEFCSDERKVWLEGEAYFQVTSKQRHPFVVVTEKASVRVFGTSFNVCFYREDGMMLTTLAEGCVEIEEAGGGVKMRMKAGEQVRLNAGGEMTKEEVDVNLYTSWKSGRLVFKSIKLAELLHNLSRWYDVEIIFRRECLKDIVFTGDLKKYEDLNEVFKMIELTSEVRFMVEGKKVIVY